MGIILKVTKNELPEREIELTVELIDEDLNPFMDRAYQKVGQQAKIDGFRKGKVPKSIVACTSPSSILQQRGHFSQSFFSSSGVCQNKVSVERYSEKKNVFSNYFCTTH